MEVDYLSVLSDAGTVHSFELGPATSIHFADPGLSKRVDQYLANVAAAFDRQRRALNIVATGSGTRRVYVSYISETPVWKATYRVVLPEGDAKPMLQGWAIVDNTGSADWSDVELSLVAGAPQSFRQPLSQPMYLRRPDVPLSEALLPTPQADSGAMNTFNTGLVVVDASGTPLPGASGGGVTLPWRWGGPAMRRFGGRGGVTLRRRGVGATWRCGDPAVRRRAVRRCGGPAQEVSARAVR